MAGESYARPPSEAEIAQGIEQFIDPGEGDEHSEQAEQETTAPTKPRPTRQPEAEDVEDESDASAAQAAQASETDEGEDKAQAKAEAETDESDGIEVPDTVDGFAEALGVDAKELLEHVRVPVKVDGVEKAIPLSEAITSYQLASHWQNRNQSLADERRSFDTDRQAFNTEREQAVQYLSGIANHLDQLFVGELKEIPESLRHEDPTEWALKREAQRERLDQLGQAKNAIGQALHQAHEQQQQAEQRAKEQHGRRLLDSVAEWASDTGLARREIADIRAFATKYGFTEDEVNRAYDSRFILAFRELKRLSEQKGEASQVHKKLKTIKLPKVTKATAAEDKTDRNRAQLRDAFGRFRGSAGTDREAGTAALTRLGLLD